MGEGSLKFACPMSRSFYHRQGRGAWEPVSGLENEGSQNHGLVVGGPGLRGAYSGV